MNEQELAKLKVLLHDILLKAFAGALHKHSPDLADDIAAELNHAIDQHIPLMQLAEFEEPAIEDLKKWIGLLTGTSGPRYPDHREH